MINESAQRALRLEKPLGQQIASMESKTIIGVLKDFHKASLTTKIAPTMLVLNPQYNSAIMVRYDPNRTTEAIQQIKMQWGNSFPDTRLNIVYADEEIAQRYASERQLGEILAIATGIAILIAILGLYGLMAFMSVRKTKEIGIRKVVGASTLKIVTMLTNEFALLVIISNLIAWPIGYLTMQSWLHHFAYRVSVSWDIFLLTGIISFGITMIAVGSQSIKAALSNPVESLRYE